MKVIRTFVAVLIAESLKANVAEVQRQLKKLAPDVKWVVPKNFHVTLKFLGNVREEALPDVFAAVEDAAERAQPFELSLCGLGAFPNPRRARVVWIGIEDGREQLIELAKSVDENLAQVGFEREEKEFKAHITIGRVRDKCPDKLAEGIETISASNLGVQKVESIAVMQSELQRSGSVYTPMQVCKLFQHSTD